MAVAISYNKDNDRFIRHKFLSLSPTSTTIYERTFDKLEGCYHKTSKKVEYVDEETGELNTVDEVIKPPVFTSHKGTLSDKGRRNLQRSIYTMLNMVNPDILIKNEHTDDVTFCTLTLPSSQIKSIKSTGIEYHATDKQIKRVAFNSFMTIIKEKFEVKFFVWVAEKQLNGSIHFHILFDRKIDYRSIRDIWNSCINNLGFVDRYSDKMKKLSASDYIALRIKDYKRKHKILPDDAEIERYLHLFHANHFEDWKNPNSTDIQKLYKVKNVAAYVCKYMSKSHGHTESDIKKQISQYSSKSDISPAIYETFYKIDGRIWQCSQTISKARKCIVVAEDTYLDEVSYLVKSNKNIKVFDDERFTTVLHSFKQFFNSCYQLYEKYYYHISSFAHDFTNTLVDCAISSLCDFKENFNFNKVQTLIAYDCT